MIKKWITDVLESVLTCGVITKASYYAKDAEKLPRTARVLKLKLGDTYIRLVLTDSDITTIINRPEKYTEPKDLTVGNLTEQALTQKSTLKFKRPHEQKLLCTIVNYFEGTCELGVDSRVAEFTESQLTTCQQRYEKIKDKLVYKMTLKQKFAEFLSCLFGIGG